jgi:hypothetical protein
MFPLLPTWGSIDDLLALDQELVGVGILVLAMGRRWASGADEVMRRLLVHLLKELLLLGVRSGSDDVALTSLHLD